MKFRDRDAERTRIAQLLVERVEVQENVLEVRTRAEGLASLVAELRQRQVWTAKRHDAGRRDRV